MTQFEFLMTFASVVLAIAVSELFGGWGKLVRSRLAVRWSPLWIGWSLVVVLTTIMYWSGIWPYRDESFREGYKIVWLAIPTFFLVVMSFLLSPEPESDSASIDLAARYWQIAPRLLPLFACFLGSSVLADFFIMPGGRVPAFEVLSRGWAAAIGSIWMVLLVTAGFSRRVWLHWGMLSFSAVPLLWFLFGQNPLFD